MADDHRLYFLSNLLGWCLDDVERYARQDTLLHSVLCAESIVRSVSGREDILASPRFEHFRGRLFAPAHLRGRVFCFGLFCSRLWDSNVPEAVDSLNQAAKQGNRRIADEPESDRNSRLQS